MSPLHFEELDQTRTIVFQSKAICIEYIYARLAEEELILPVTEYEHLKSSGTPEEVFAVLLKLSDEMESLCPYVYRDIAKQMNIPLDVENVVADTFFTLAMDITASGVTWGKVVAIYALAGALAVDCVYQGQTAMIYAIVDSMGVFAYKYLSPWLLHRGGWMDIMNCIDTPAPDLQAYWISNITSTWRNVWQILVIRLTKAW